MRADNPHFTVGTHVQLRGCRHGEPGIIIRIERKKWVVLWRDLDYIARHIPASLVLVETAMNASLQSKTAIVEAHPTTSRAS